jgi:Carboxypeptidase regulatory-like domain/Divergent InlB B-repeat domain
VEALLKSKFWAVGVACFLVFCVAPASAFAGSISGQVTDAATALPMDEVNVCAEGLGSTSTSCVEVLESGEYTIEDLEAGEYRVSFQPNFGISYVHQYFPATLNYEDATVFSLESSEDLTGIDAAMEEGATLSGTVVGEDGAGPLEEVEVCAEEPVGPWGDYCERTDLDGSYQIVGMPAGSYKVVFESRSSGVEYATRYYDEKSFEEEAEEIELEAGDEFTADATMVRSGAIEGNVTEDGRPRGFDTVCIYTTEEVEVGCTLAEEDGSYRWEGLPVGSYILELEFFEEALQFSGGAKTFAEATPVTVEAETTAIENFELAGPPGISGTLTDTVTGDPIEEGQACAASLIAGTDCVQVQSGGEYTIPLEAGTYEVYFEADGYMREFWDGVPHESEATPVIVGESMVTGIDAEMSPAGMISGHVTLAGAGTNLGTVNVCAFDQSGASVECNTSSPSTGNYTIRELPPGEYKVGFTRAGYGTQYYDGKATIAEADPVTVTGGETNTGIDAAMVRLVRPANTSPPELSGVGKVGETLTCTQGVWANNPTSYEFYWSRNGREIHGAEADTYKLTTADAGKTIKCGVLAENGAGHSNVVESTASINVLAIRQLTVTTFGSGTVASAPAGIECGSTCATSGNEGEAVTLTAAPAAHSEFIGWSGACTGVGICEVTFGATDSSVTATFAPITHPVSVAVTGSGSVSADSGAISGCTEAGGTCSGGYDEGTEVTLTATPDAHHTFTGWTGCTTESGPECNVTVEAVENVTADFAPITHQLTVAKSGDGSGTVTSSPAGIDCGAACAAGFDEDASVTLTAVADPGSEFTGWSGAGCSGAGTCVVTLGEDASVVADFAKKPEEGGGNGGGSTDGSSGPSSPASIGSPSPPSTSTPAPKRVAKKKPLQCKKGFHKVKLKGKVHCAKPKPKGKKAKAKRT